MITYSVPVPVAEMLLWAHAIEDEVGLDGVVDAIRARASAPDGDLCEIMERVRAMGTVGFCSPSWYLCPYHKGWHDALNAFEDRWP